MGNRTKILTSITLKREDIEFLEKLSNEIKFNGGAKLGKALLIRAMIRSFKSLGKDKVRNRLISMIEKVREKEK